MSCPDSYRDEDLKMGGKSKIIRHLFTDEKKIKKD